MTSLDVETAALVRHATGRHSDALACQAIGRYVQQVGAVPPQAWGSMEWVQTWKGQWADACADRVQEAKAASERFDDIGQTLYRVAGDYAHTDIRAATDFAAISQSPIMAFVDAPADQPVTVPDTTPEGHQLNNLLHDGSVGREQLWPAGTDVSKTPQGILEAEMNTAGRKKLWEFILQWSGELRTAETIVLQWGLAPAESSTAYIDKAADAWPGIIANRANLLKLGANAYRDLRENLNNQVKDLQQYWSSPASGAYCIYADSLGNYYESIAGHLQWLGDEGTKAARTIDDLQLAFASLGYEHINIIATQLQAYNEAAAGLSHAVSDPLNALADALSALTSSLIDSWKSAAAKTQATLSITQKVIDNAPDFTDNTHNAEQPPPSPSNTWRGNGWKPSN